MAKKKPATPSAHFGARLAELRKAAGYTQVQLADEIGISQRMISYYEKTDDHPIAKVLRHFAQALEVSTDELLGVAPMSGKPTRKTRGKRGD
jgi:transcriptional regulator with XRE-family HTH domain